MNKVDIEKILLTTDGQGINKKREALSSLFTLLEQWSKLEERYQYAMEECDLGCCFEPKLGRLTDETKKLLGVESGN